jgi:hypothetical protein
MVMTFASLPITIIRPLGEIANKQVASAGAFPVSFNNSRILFN